jgi:signal transduction histidine kinase
MVFMAIACIGPVLWALDCLVVSILFKTDFLQQFFSPRGFDLGLCLLLLFFPVLVAYLFNPRPPAEEKLEELKEIEEAVRIEEQKKFAGQLAAGIQEERKKSEEQARALEAGFAQEIASKVSAECKRVEEEVRREEHTKLEAEIKAQEARFVQELASRVESERKLVEESVRLDERKKLESKTADGIEARQKREEQAAAIEARFEQELALKVASECKRVEESVRLEEQKKAEAAVRALRQKFDELLRSGQDDERKRIEELVRMEEQKKMAEQIRDLDERYAQQVSARIAQERGRIEEGVRLEEQKKAAEAVRALRQKYEDQARSVKDEKNQAPQAAQDLSRLVNGLSQQILHPLGGVLNNIKLIKIKMLQGGDPKAKEVKDALDFIEENALLCKNILFSMSSMSGSAGVSFQLVDLNDLVAKIDSLMGHEMKLQNISIQKVLQDKLPQVSGDPALLTQVLFNIVTNAKWAIKSNPAGGAGTITITTQTTPAKDAVELIVSDNGKGISADDILHIFDPFFTTKPDALGLGLPVAQRIIKAHKGDIQAESKKDKATAFTITLPAVS